MKKMLIVLMMAAGTGAFAQQNSSRYSDAVPAYYPLDRTTPVAYIGVPFKVNSEYKNRDGDYKVELRICDTNNVCIGKLFIGPYAQFTSTSPDDAGKNIEVTTFFRPAHSGSWQKVRSAYAKIEPAPLEVIVLEKLTPDHAEHIQAYYGIEGYSTPPSSEYLEVKSGGYFEEQAVKMPKVENTSDSGEHEEMAQLSADYILKPAEKTAALQSPTHITITFTDPKTARSFSKEVTLLPPGKTSK